MFEPGLARAFPDTSSPGTRYEHTDLLGTSKAESYATEGSSIVAREVFTAFGERVCSLDGGSTCPAFDTFERYGYVGAHGYQANKSFPFLHVGARYYDPSTGRFLQGDPVGIEGGLNVYEYAWSSPTWLIDPDGDQAGPQPGGSNMGSAQPETARVVADAVKQITTGKHTRYLAKATRAATKAAQKAGKDAMKKFRTNKAFQRFVERYKKDVRGTGFGRRNPNLNEAEMSEAWEAFKAEIHRGPGG